MGIAYHFNNLTKVQSDVLATIRSFLIENPRLDWDEESIPTFVKWLKTQPETDITLMILNEDNRSIINLLRSLELLED